MFTVTVETGYGIERVEKHLIEREATNSLHLLAEEFERNSGDCRIILCREGEEYRRIYSGEHGNSSHKNLENMAFARETKWRDYSQSYLSGRSYYVKIKECSFWGATISFDFANSQFHNCNFNNVNMQKSCMKEVQFVNCDFSHGNLSEVDFSKAKFVDCTFYKTNLLSADLSMASFVRCDFSDANLIKTNLRVSQFKECEIYCSYMEGADLAYSKIEDSNFMEVSIVNANFRDCYLKDSDIRPLKVSVPDFG
jgi:uncharacterized protein YjbI with pentapeptide repeats